MADLDEYWYCLNSKLVKELPKYENYDVIYSRWRMFGTHLVEQPIDIRMANNLREEKFNDNTKYIMRT